MKSMNASEFKARCLAVLDQVQRDGEPVLILKRGRVVARLASAYVAKAAAPRDRLKGTLEVVGDVIGPVLPAEAWHAVTGKGK
jgi:prevent-host-death family protein